MIARPSRSDARRGRVRSRPAPTVRRASARRTFAPRRALAALAMLASGLAFYGLTASPAFDVRTVTARGAALTGEGAVSAALALPTGALDSGGAGVSVVTLETAPLAARVATLPAVASATVRTALPDAVEVSIVEREPILVWAAGSHRYLVDREGRILADAAASDATPAASARMAGLQVVTDARDASESLAPGAFVDPIDLDVATRLASLTPADIGSKATGIAVSVDDATGWSLSIPGGWTAVFGIYTGTVRPPDLVPAQVRLLRSLLAVREGRLKRVILASGEAGTYSLR